MDNKKYLDKVLDHLVKGTKIDYEKELLFFPFQPPSSFFFSLSFLLYNSLSQPLIINHSFHFSNYCKNTFGLTEDEIKYVWNEYKKIILDKINNGE